MYNSFKFKYTLSKFNHVCLNWNIIYPIHDLPELQFIPAMATRTLFWTFELNEILMLAYVSSNRIWERLQFEPAITQQTSNAGAH